VGKPSVQAKKEWARQFLADTPDELVHADLGGGHLVLARRNVDAGELRS
jgi:peptide/nickel transport system ATP-binding protein